MGGGENSNGNTEDEGDEETDEADGGGDEPALGDDFVNGVAFVAKGGAEVALGEVENVFGVLDDERLIEAGMFFHFFDEVGGNRFFVEEGATGSEARDEEGDRDDAEQGEEGLEKAVGDEAKHFGGDGAGG